MSAKHTPGPWFVDRNHFGKIIGVASDSRRDDLNLVASLSLEADARLIAAAPDLLAFARYVLRGLAYGGISAKPILDMSDPEAEEYPMTSLSEMAQKVINKAEGRAE